MSLRILHALIAAIVLAGGTNSGKSHQDRVRFPASTRLDDASVREAVALSEKHRPAPYWLYPRPGRHQATVAVYTPFIRVALAAYTALQRGERLSVSELPAWLADREVHVVLRPQTTTAAAHLFPEDPSLRRTPMTQIVLGRPGAFHLDGIPPKWMTTDLSYLDAIGGPPFADAVAAAAFDPELMVQKVDVWGFWQKDNHVIPSHGVLDPNEIRTWR